MCLYEGSHKLYVQWNYKWNISKWWNQICLFFCNFFCYWIYFLYDQVVLKFHSLQLFFPLSLLLELSRFQWQCSLECFNLLHWPQITFIFLPLLAFSYLVGGSSNFQYSLVSPILSSQMIIAFLCSNKVSLFIPNVAIQKYGYKHVRKKVVNKLSYAWCWR